MDPVDRLSSLLERFRIRAALFHAGPLCGVTTFAAKPGRGFLHVLREGEMSVTHLGADGRLETLQVDEPSLLFYPRPLEHAFHNAPTDDSDFACATVDVAGGGVHPLFLALPPVVVVPLDAVPTLRPALDLLFAEVDAAACGQRVIVDRLFEVVLMQLFRWMLDHADQVGLPAGLLTGLADPALARALVALHEAPGERWSLTSLAAAARLSRSTFAARFTALVGVPPVEYLTTWRVMLAQEMLLAGQPVGLTASRLGYASAPAFSRAFTQRVGVSPRAWAATAGV
ncbi:AraC family transcriptional regulator [Herbiconiux sp. KACC 21604]|uniref:AraC family transcriptional regulator n=1 Tax=unclassified Herbiconiux TaxID=2618217 RepID=UPI001490E286|nr:AraC family transcriptional regulator [Herbiconiux sp. SALV-R1]QJU55328.1 AraC family transcriptional regulator [Herbiconiux sp. SALV-R1]WPO86496.1 AraC family transcriptional regulator [Herbiconiux sp. KACC 21604]